MFSRINFFNAKKEFYPIVDNDVLIKKAIEFSKPENLDISELKSKIISLEDCNRIESPLKSKLYIEFDNSDELLNSVMYELNNNFRDYTEEFKASAIGFTYYFGNDLFYSNTVEIVQKIYHKENLEIGDIYYSLVIKFFNRKYRYWMW